MYLNHSLLKRMFLLAACVIIAGSFLQAQRLT